MIATHPLGAVVNFPKMRHMVHEMKKVNPNLQIVHEVIFGDDAQGHVSQSFQ
jgi:hypothetical protein